MIIFLTPFFKSFRQRQKSISASFYPSIYLCFAPGCLDALLSSYPLAAIDQSSLVYLVATQLSSSSLFWDSPCFILIHSLVVARLIRCRRLQTTTSSLPARWCSSPWSSWQLDGKILISPLSSCIWVSLRRHLLSSVRCLLCFHFFKFTDEVVLVVLSHGF